MSQSTAATTTSPRTLSGLDQFILAAAWFGYNVQWGALLPVVLPSQIAAIVGPQHKEFFNGLVGPMGAVIALIIAPVSGALSDRSVHAWGRRRPYMLVGALANLVFLLMAAGFGKGSHIWLFCAVFMGLQLGCNWLGGPYAGLIPDVVPEKQRGSASGWMALMTAIGTLVGALAAGQMLKGDSYWPVYLLIFASMGLSTLITLAGVRETPRREAPGPFNLAEFGRSFLLDPKEHRNFYWVLITRCLVTMGVYSVFTFFQYFLADVIKVPDPVEQSSYLVGIIIAMGIPTSILAGSLSDRFGRKPMVYLSGAVMAAASIIFIGVALLPSTPMLGLPANLLFTFVVAALFGIGNGAYQAVDWALAIDVLPGGEDAAKDMGIWHAALVLPQILAPFITGVVLSAIKPHSLMMGYTTVFIMTAVWLVLGTVLVRQVRGVR